jgi:hypothetical protein
LRFGIVYVCLSFFLIPIPSSFFHVGNDGNLVGDGLFALWPNNGNIPPLFAACVLSRHDTVPICPINIGQHSSAIITDGFVENQIDHRGKSWE